MRHDWNITLGGFSMYWKEPLSEKDVDDIERLSALAVRGMRRRLAERNATAPQPETA